MALVPGAIIDGDAVFVSPAMKAVVEVVDRVKDTNVPVMIFGQSGTGKEVVAKLMHRKSRRAEGTFVSVNCAAIPKDLADSELFGHEKGAFTGAAVRRKGRFEEASGGTLFLDEIAELDLAVQAKLLRVLQEGEVMLVGGGTVKVDTRIVVATHRMLAAEVRAGTFREDLYHRLNVITLHLPPLKERPEETPFLAQHLLDRFVRQEGLPRRTLSLDAIEILKSQPWPGNVRQLENVLKRSALLARGPLIGPSDLVLQGASALDLDAITPAAVQRVMTKPEPILSIGHIRRNERDRMVRALEETRGNVSEAARRMGIARATFYRRAKRYGLEISERADERE